MSRRSEIAHKPKNIDFNISLFENALKDPASKNLILQALSANQKNVFELFKPGSESVNSPVRKVKRKEHCESPTALLRRRELEKKNRPERPESAQSHTSEQSTQSSASGGSTIPFGSILRNVNAYVEINSNGNDRSGGAKALLRSMGATVSEKFTRDVTHVIFKDGLYTTYQRAKLLKVHLVSVLWLEASRRNGFRAQEKNYPALGTKNYDLNVSMICSQMQKDYEEVIRDEIRRTLESGTPLPTTKSFVENRRKTVGSTSKSFDTGSQFATHSFKKSDASEIIQRIRGQSTSKKSQPPSMILGGNSPAVSTDEELSNISKKIHSDILNSSLDSFRATTSMTLAPNRESDSASECGMIDGDFSQKESLVDDSLNRMVAPLQSEEIFTSAMELTCDDDSDSQSVASNRSYSKNRTSNSIKNMDLTTPTGGILQNLKGSLLNSLSYLSSRNQNLSDVTKQKNNEKENFSTPSPKKTLKPTKLKFAKSKSSAKKEISVENNTFSTPTVDDGNVMSEDDFYSLKTPKIVATNQKFPKPVNLLTHRKGQDDDDRDLHSDMSTLRISVGSDGIACNTKNSINNSTNNIKENTGNTSSSMSSLRLSKSSIENSSNSIVPSFRISPDEQVIRGTSAGIELTQDKENREIQNDTDPKPLLSTPFVTERKKRNPRKSVKAELPVGVLDFSTPEAPVRNTRSSRRESSILNKNKREFEEELKNTKTSHDKSKEVEIVAPRESLVSTPRPARKFASKTPSKSDVFHSPFVNTRPRRQSTLKTIEEKKAENNLKLQAGSRTRPTRRSCRAIGQSVDTPKKVEESNRGLLDTTLDNQSSDEESEKEQSVSGPNKLPNILEVEETPELHNFTNKSLKPIVLLQDILVSPTKSAKSVRQTRRQTLTQQNECVVSLVSVSNKDLKCSPPKRMKYDENAEKESETGKNLRTRRSKSVAVGETLEVDDDNEDDEKEEERVERKSRRKTMRVLSEVNIDKNESMSKSNRRPEKCEDNKRETLQKKVSRSKSESDVRESRIRKSRRIRKLYDPDRLDEDEKIQERLGVNDQEERKTIRQEKVMKVNVVSQNGWLNGNLLMSQKAMEYLEKTQENMTTLFKEPESVLDQLGIDKRKKGEKKKESIMNNSADEQVDLAEEFVNKRVKKSSKDSDVNATIHSFPAVGPTPKNKKCVLNLTQKAWTTGSRQRRSTMEFAPKPLSVPKVRTKLNLDLKPTIVCTKMHKKDVEVFNSIVKKLGRFEVEDEVSSRTTHLVVGEPKRTVNMLRALSRGCWVLRQEWLLSSLEHDGWLPEEKYEAVEFSPVVQQCRLRRQAFGPTYHMSIFLDCGSIYVAKSTIPRSSDIRELITLCGGKVTKIPDNAQVAVGVYLEDCDCVNEFWVLDSITSGKLLPLEEYAITAESAKTKSPFV